MMYRLSLLVFVLACVTLAAPQTDFIPAAAAGQSAGSVQGTVTEVIAAAGYTYVQIDTGTDRVWAAGPDTPLKVGDRIGVSTDMPMMNFHSKSMQRDFDVIYFVDNYLRADSGEEAVKSAHKQSPSEPVGEPVAGIAKLANGYTIAEIQADRQRLQGKTVRVRGKVIKFTPAIMGKNWVHIMDSSSRNDLTLTTSATANVNDVVVIEGTLALDRDFNYGYFYPLLLENGTVTKE